MFNEEVKSCAENCSDSTRAMRSTDDPDDDSQQENIPMPDLEQTAAQSPGAVNADLEQTETQVPGCWLQISRQRT